MKQSDYQQFCKIMLETAEAVDKALSAEKIAVFFKDLADIDIRAFRFAMEKHRKESEFFPRVAKILELAKMWKAPVPPGLQGREVKLLESPADKAQRIERNKVKIRELLDGLGQLDALHGTNLKEKVNARERLQVLQEQKEIVRGM